MSDNPQTGTYRCTVCGRTFSTEDELRDHELDVHKRPGQGGQESGE
jgi:hypothetical protein